MKITVKHKETEITISEQETDNKDRITTMRWSDQNELIQETIKVISEQIIKITNSQQ